MTDFLDEKRKEIDTRLKELRPLVEEYDRLEKAVAALDGVGSDSLTRKKGSSKSSLATKVNARSRRSRSGTGRRGRPRGSGKRAAEARRLVNERPGITIPELADAMGIQANYLYRVMPTLQKEGEVRKRGKGWHPADADAAS
jgi:hypothetical protein